MPIYYADNPGPARQTMTDLQISVALILSQARGHISIREPSGSITTLAIADYDGSVDFAALVRASGAGSEAQSEHLDLLRVLYSRVSEDLQNDFWEAVHKGLTRDTGEVIGHLIVELRRLDLLSSPLSSLSWEERESEEALTMLWHALRTKLALQPVMFSDDDVASVVDGASNTWQLLVFAGGSIPVTKRRLAAELSATIQTGQRVRYLRLKDQLLKVENPEINTDRRELVSRYEALHFSGELVAAINQVERQIRSAATAVEFRGCMDLLRVIFEETFEESAKQIETKLGTTVPTGPKVGNFQPFRQYLANAKLLSLKESEVAQALYNYVSQDGSHSLGSGPEQLRVTKNTVIEWCLMLVGRVQTFLQ